MNKKERLYNFLFFTGEVLKNVKGEKTTIEESCKDKVVGLYFSAHWVSKIYELRGFKSK